MFPCVCLGLSFPNWTILRRFPVRWWATSCITRSVAHTGLTGADDDFNYFQTNYFVSVALVFLTVFFFVPWKMLYIVIVLALGNNIVILAKTIINYFSHFSIPLSVWSSVLHVPAPRPCQGLEEESPHRCHVRHFRHWQFSDLPGWLVLFLQDWV